MNDEIVGFCPARKIDDVHCVHWWDGDACCACDAPAMLEGEKREQEMDESCE